MSAGELARTVEKRISNSAWAAASVADVQLEGYVERRAGSYHAHVKLTSKSGAILGERDLENEDPTCGPLDQAVTLMLALVLDPSLLSRAERPADAPSPPLRATRPEAIAASPAPAQDPGASNAPLAVTAPAAPIGLLPMSPGSPSAELALGFALGAGLLPGISAGIAMTEKLALDRTWLYVSGALWMPRDAAAGTRGSNLSLATLDLGVCPVILSSSSSLLLGCAGMEGGIMVVRGFGFADPRELRMRPVVMGSLSIEPSLRIAQRLWAGLRISGKVPIIRDQVVFVDAAGNQVELFRMSSVAGTVALSLAVRF
jgi:hypothetical protein